MVYLGKCLKFATRLSVKGHRINGGLYQGVNLLDSDKNGMQNVEIIPKRFKSQKLSYVHGIGKTPLSADHLGNFVDRAAELFPKKTAVVDVHQNIRRNYLQYKHDVDQLAMGLLALKLNRGDRVGILCPNRYEWIMSEMAAAKVGLIVVPLNPGYQAPEIDYSIKKLEMRAIITQESFRVLDYYKILTQVVPEIADTKPGSKIKSKKHPYFDTLIMMTDKELPGVFKYGDLFGGAGSVEKQKLDQLKWKIQCSDPAIIIFTSGTTGSPKGATLSHHTVVNGPYTMADKYGYGEMELRLCTPIPLFHGFGCTGVILSALMSGCSLVLPSQGYNVGDTLKAITNEKCSGICGSPTMFVDILNHPDFPKADCSHLKRALVGGSSVPPQLAKTIMEKMTLPGLLVGYGTSEVSGGAFVMHNPDDHPDEVLRSCGWIYDFMECKIVDENNQIVPIGTVGEICFRGYKVLLGYWGDEERTKEAITKDGWYLTGDLGLLNENETITITGRSKDMILRGGENIYPLEVESFLVTHPKIADAQAVGIPDDRLGEQVCAWIVLKANQSMTEEELKRYCKDKIAHYKIPHYVRFVSEFPKTLSGKVKKFAIKEEMIKSLGIQTKVF